MNGETPRPAPSRTKPVVLVLVETYLPGYMGGGPVRSIANLVERLGEDFHFKIVTRDRDLGATAAYPDVAIGRWTRVGAAEVFYASPELLSPSGLIGLLRHTAYDLLYVNSFFSPKFSILPVAAPRVGLLPPRPVLIAPRGEFSAGAYALKSWKKKPFVRLARLAGLYADAHWHASTEHEAEDIARVMRPASSRIHIASNLTAATLSPVEGGIRLERGPLRVCFLSRITRKKNLDFALRVLAKTQAPIEFTIYGPAEDAAYWAECQALIARLPPHVKVRALGPVPNDEVRATLAQHDVFFLPTLGENFGHVFVEAWSGGLSVLTSDQTPWRRLAEAGVGWDLPLSHPDSFVRVINEFCTVPPVTLSELRERCRAFIRQRLDDQQDLMANANMLASLAALNGAAGNF